MKYYDKNKKELKVGDRVKYLNDIGVVGKRTGIEEEERLYFLGKEDIPLCYLAPHLTWYKKNTVTFLEKI